MKTLCIRRLFLCVYYSKRYCYSIQKFVPMCTVFWNKFTGETHNNKNEKPADVKSEYFKETKAKDLYGSEPVRRAPPRKILKVSTRVK